MHACSLVSCHCSRATAAACMQFGILPRQVTAEHLYAVWETAAAAGQQRAHTCIHDFYIFLHIGLLHMGLLHIGFLHIGFLLKGEGQNIGFLTDRLFDCQLFDISVFWLSAFCISAFCISAYCCGEKYQQKYRLFVISAFWLLAFCHIGFLTYRFFASRLFVLSAFWYRLFDRRLVALGFLPDTILAPPSPY
jgi:hypothetical protein